MGPLTDADDAMTDVALVNGGRVEQIWRNSRLSEMTRHPPHGRLVEVPAGQVAPGMLLDRTTGLFHSEHETHASEPRAARDGSRIVIESHVHHAPARELTLLPAVAAAVEQRWSREGASVAAPAAGGEVVRFVPSPRHVGVNSAARNSVAHSAADLTEAIEAAVDEIERELQSVAGRLDAASWNAIVDAVADMTVGLLRAQSLNDIATLRNEVSAAISRAA